MILLLIVGVEYSPAVSRIRTVQIDTIEEDGADSRPAEVRVVGLLRHQSLMHDFEGFIEVREPSLPELPAIIPT